ncbi:DUF4252 domain-containing protein [Joostella sp. CR20]|uniref:DUF4252 domain-containing protein n=1 Tax=Joostella sp. CR20 TaxID=2804312 RepID=UPI00313D36AC
MKSVLLLFAVAVLCVSCGASTPYSTFRKENKDQIAITLSASNFLVSMFVDKDDLSELKEVVSGIHRYRILVGDEAFSNELESKFSKFVGKKGYESLMYVNSDGSKVSLYYYERKNKIKEVLMRVKDDEDFVVLSAEGNIKIKDMEGLVNSVSFTTD